MPATNSRERHLSERQSAVLRVLSQRIIETGDPPYLHEIADAVGLTSRSSVHY
ncbi:MULTISPECIES: hypothetical protein [unclassified Streptomyces]|uniref:LexA family protein n=1 Tax=unclassified Streptomyces TaxID=2593676 RepID=UPI002DDBF38C|nr:MULTISPECIES: hypothetical protein [unclassified Streptomyces]WSA97618.1 hypothetical protein OIE63_39565 [Streptomyces sp. NBC_01795]WSB82132.1 hypothetical protein OHB04_41250 [Streptomyces sp. NBC_01775]WSS18103.1 hypothetical protein OG533_40330 [Streptomyces sp. NBC_01186]WSS46893.1 hypothetical protein OG220_40815 [Streptomyces sp. NBC_01187]